MFEVRSLQWGDCDNFFVHLDAILGGDAIFTGENVPNTHAPTQLTRLLCRPLENGGPAASGGENPGQ